MYLSRLVFVLTALSIAAFAMQFWGANIDTLPIDIFPSEHAAQTVGFTGLMGAIGGVLIASTVGLVLQFTGSYLPIFAIAGSAYLAALGIIHLLAPRLEPANVEAAVS